MQKGSKYVSCIIENDLKFKQVEKTTKIQNKNDSHKKNLEIEIQVIDQMLSAIEKEKGILLFHL